MKRSHCLSKNAQQHEGARRTRARQRKHDILALIYLSEVIACVGVGERRKPRTRRGEFEKRYNEVKRPGNRPYEPSKGIWKNVRLGENDDFVIYHQGNKRSEVIIFTPTRFLDRLPGKCIHAEQHPYLF